VTPRTEAHLISVVCGVCLGALLALTASSALRFWSHANEAQLRADAAQAVELRLALRARDTDLRICKTRLAGYAEVAAVAEALDRAAAGRTR
jgi:hypothetical protein